MHNNSKAVTSNQTGVHKRLVEAVQKHADAAYLKPYRSHNLEAFEQLKKALSENTDKEWILDSCCGTGRSTRLLAERNPNALVIGIDQSADRLSRGTELNTPENCLFIQANCEDIWRLLAEEELRFSEHYILYPNPYPKSVHYKRRWHAHPAFPALPLLSKTLVLRSNWHLYLEEFELAWETLGHLTQEITEVINGSRLTLFEIKYQQSGQPVYQLVCQSK